METRCADPTLQLDVDVMILDFLVYSALDTTLKTAPSNDADRALRMVDGSTHSQFITSQTY